MPINKMLGVWCEENGLEYLAWKADITAGYVHKLIRGDRLPSRKLARRIQRITKGAIKAESWEKARIARDK